MVEHLLNMSKAVRSSPSTEEKRLLGQQGGSVGKGTSSLRNSWNSCGKNRVIPADCPLTSGHRYTCTHAHMHMHALRHINT